MIEFKNIEIKYGDFVAIKDLNLTVGDGEFFTFLGPSGCGKTTTLRALVGFLEPSAGQILIDGKDVTHTPVEKRNIGMVFQSYALFPTMTVYENLAFGLKVKKLSAAEIDRKVKDVAKVIEIKSEQLVRNVSELSGGQQQRVALARAIVLEPKILCLDEPLSNLDAKLRVGLRSELKKLQKNLGITTLYVTHDQEEALTMSDTVVVMDKGRIQQIGTPEDIYNEPKNAFVADFIGESNILNGVMVRDNVVKMYGREFPCVDGGFAPNEPVDVVIRPEDIDIVPVEQGQLVGTVTSVTFKGMQYDIIVDFRGFKWLIQTTDHSPEGARIGVKIDPDGFHIMKKSEYSGQFGDYSSYSEEYEELADASLETDEEESGDEE